MTAAGPGELLTKVTVPAGRRDGFASVPIGADGTCIVNAAASLDGDGPRVVVGCVDAVPHRATGVEAKLGGTLDAAGVKAAVQGLGATLDPPSDVHASSDYRRHLAEVVAARAILQATEAGG
jgi:CO/xanthine dehydrogenase FAD-binding subunit